jgi:hypothetical protein
MYHAISGRFAEHFGDRRGPASAADDRKFWRVYHGWLLAPMAAVSFCFFFKKQKIKQYSGITS